MKPRPRYQPHLAAILLLFILVGIPICDSAKVPPQTQEDRDWVDNTFVQVLDQLMPIKRKEGMYVAYRSRPALLTEVLEYSFLIGYDFQENQPGLQDQLSVHVRIADAVSVYDQMMKMHRANPREASPSIEKKIRVKAWDLNEKSCPAIRTQFDKLDKVGFGPLDFLTISLDPPYHEFHIQAGAGDFDMTLVDEKHPLVQWALETRLALELCIVASSANAR
jgi:hypothetical protein